MDEPQPTQAPYTPPVTPAPPAPAPYVPPAAPAPAPPVTPPPSGSHTGLLLGILAALVLVAAAAYYFLVMKPGGVAEVSPSPSASSGPMLSVTPTPTTGTTTGWQTYTNASTQFSFRHPVNMTVTEDDKQAPGSPTKRWVIATGSSPDVDVLVEINNPGRGGSGIFQPVSGTVTADGVTITYRAGKSLAMGATTPGTTFLWQAQFTTQGNDYIVEFSTADGVDRTTLVRDILSTFKFTP